MVTNNSWNSEDPAQVARGGTGAGSHTAYAVLTGGTTSTNPIQSIAGVGTSGQVLTSNGAAALPTFQDAASGGGGQWQYISTTTASNDATIDFTSLTLTGYKIVILNLVPQTDDTDIYCRVSTSSTFAALDYSWSRDRNRQGSGDQAGTGNDIQWRLTSGSIGTASGEFGLCGEVIVLGTATASLPAYSFWSFGYQDSSGGDYVYADGAGVSAAEANGGSTANVDGIRLFMSSDNISTGTFHFYSLVTS